MILGQTWCPSMEGLYTRRSMGKKCLGECSPYQLGLERNMPFHEMAFKIIFVYFIWGLLLLLLFYPRYDLEL